MSQLTFKWNRQTGLRVFVVLILAGSTLWGAPIPIANVQRTEAVLFEKDVLPILQRSCLACHSASERQGDLVLESPETLRKGGDTGPAILPGRGAESLMLKLASHQDEPAMPPPGNDVNAKPLSSEELGLLRLWIDQGARGTDGAALLSPKQWQALPQSIAPIYAVALTEDGQYVAASRANQLFLHHVPTGRLVTRLTDPNLAAPNPGATSPQGVAHRDLIQSLAFNVQGDLLASGSFREVKLWRRPSDVQLRQLAAGGPVTALAVSPDRKWIATPGANHAVRLWNAETGEPGPTLTGHTDKITALKFTPDGTRLTSASLDQTLRLWAIADGRSVGVIETPAAVNAVELVAESLASEQQPIPPQLLVSGGADNLLRTWTMPESAPLKLANTLANPQRAAFSPDRRWLALSNAEGTIQVLSAAQTKPGEPASFQPITEFKTELGAATALAFVPVLAPPGNSLPPRLISAGADGLISHWSLPEHRKLGQWRGEAVSVSSLAASRDGKLLAAGAENGVISLWDLEALAKQADQPPAGEAAGMPAVPPFGFVRHCAGNVQAITGLVFHSNGQTLFSTARDGSFRGYNAANGQQNFATNHGAAINALALSPDELVLATAGENNQVRLWQTNGSGFGPQQLAGFLGPVKSVAFSADGTKILAGSAGDKPTVLAFDLQSGIVLQRCSTHSGPVLALGAIGSVEEKRWLTVVVSASADGLWQWSLYGLRHVPGHGAAVTALAALPGTPKQVFSGSLDATVRRWNLDNGQQLGQYNHGGAVVGLAVRPDGQRLASASDNHVAKLWNVNGQPIAEMRGDVRRKTLAARLTQQQNAANQRVALAKQRLDAAEKDVPVKTEAEKKAAESLATATKGVQDKQAALQKSRDEKTAAEKLAIESSTAARQMLLVKTQAEDAAKDAAAQIPAAQQKAALLVAAANAAAAEAAAMKKTADDAQLAVVTAQQKAQQLQQAIQALTQAAQTAINAANEAAQKVTLVQKPYNDALAALRTAESAQNLAAQQHVIAARELKAAQEVVPGAKDTVAKADQSLAEVKKSLDVANQETNAADQAIRAIAFSPDGSRLATGGEFPSVHTWDGETGTALSAFAGHAGPLAALAFLDDGRIVSGSQDQSARVWDLNPGWRLERTIGAIDHPEIISDRVQTLHFNNDNSLLLVGGGVPSRNGELHVFQVADGKRTLFLPQAHDDVIYAARFSPDGKRLASGGADKYLRTFDLASAQQLRRFEGHTHHVLGLAWKGDGQTLVSASADQTIKAWNAETADQNLTIPNFAKHVTAVRYIGETDNVASSSGDRLVRMHNASNGGNFRNFGGPTSWLHCVDVTPDSNVLAAGSATGQVHLWNGNTGQPLKTLTLGE